MPAPPFRHRRPARRAGAALLLSAALLATPTPRVVALDLDLPDLGNSAGTLMTPKRERELGQAFMRNVRRSQKVMDDPLLTDYLQQLGQRLVEASESGAAGFEFILIDSPQINAFAGPGGHIGVYTGLLLTTETESELAAVLAHEIAHVTQQHLLRAWESSSQMSIPNAAILLAAIVLGATVGGDAAAAAAVGGQAAVIQRQINFTRANEQEADRVGIEILARAGHEPRAMPAFFDRMGKANRVYASKLPEYLMTHPVTTSRIADAMGRAEQHAYRQNADNLRYHLARADLVQRRFERPEDAIRELELMIEDGRFRNATAAHYAVARAQIRAQRLDDADATLGHLLEEHPDTIEFIVTKAEAEAARGDRAAALRRLEAALARRPASYALNVAYAETALAHGESAKALAQLQRYVAYRPDEPRLFLLLAQAAGESGRASLGHEYMAEHYYLGGDVEAAVVQLDIALKREELNFFDASRIESRRAELKAEQDLEKERSTRP